MDLKVNIKLTCLVYLEYSGFNEVFLCVVYSICMKMLTCSLFMNYQDLPVLVHKQ